MGKKSSTRESFEDDHFIQKYTLFSSIERHTLEMSKIKPEDDKPEAVSTTSDLGFKHHSPIKAMQIKNPFPLAKSTTSWFKVANVRMLLKIVTLFFFKHHQMNQIWRICLQIKSFTHNIKKKNVMYLFAIKSEKSGFWNRSYYCH